MTDRSIRGLDEQLWITAAQRPSSDEFVVSISSERADSPTDLLYPPEYDVGRNASWFDRRERSDPEPS